jgi:hypothetical protein
MSEFKFACPVCGQHITADSNSSGTPLTCPTCFQKIIVPQAPSLPDSKLILSAAQASKGRPAPADIEPSRARPHPSALLAALPGLVLLLVLAGGGAAAYVWRDKLSTLTGTKPGNGSSAQQSSNAPVPRTVYPVPTNIIWSLDITNATIPEARTAGRLHREGFFCEHATLTGGNLTLRQGPHWPPELGLTVVLFARSADELSGKTVVVSADRQPPLPRVILRWKNRNDKAVTRTYTNGYALKVVFGKAAAGRIAGKLYLAFPDPAQSVAAGTFDAIIHKPRPAPRQ